MATFLLDCEVSSMKLEIPSAHRQVLLGFFDGSRHRDRVSTRAVAEGDELRLENEGGRMLFVEKGNVLTLRELEIFEDRGGEFFGRVAVNLFVTYKGRLKCRLKWDAQGVADANPLIDVEVQDGKTNWKGEFNAGAWLPNENLPEVAGEEEVEYVRTELPADVAAKHVADIQDVAGDAGVFQAIGQCLRRAKPLI
ncbi:MAG: hypothetical protein ACK4N5_05840, partial [Myxococcales bacterium]